MFFFSPTWNSSSLACVCVFQAYDERALLCGCRCVRVDDTKMLAHSLFKLFGSFFCAKSAFTPKFIVLCLISLWCALFVCQTTIFFDIKFTFWSIQHAKCTSKAVSCCCCCCCVFILYICLFSLSFAVELFSSNFSFTHNTQYSQWMKVFDGWRMIVSTYTPNWHR